MVARANDSGAGGEGEKPAADLAADAGTTAGVGDTTTQNLLLVTGNAGKERDPAGKDLTRTGDQVAETGSAHDRLLEASRDGNTVATGKPEYASVDAASYLKARLGRGEGLTNKVQLDRSDTADKNLIPGKESVSGSEIADLAEMARGADPKAARAAWDALFSIATNSKIPAPPGGSAGDTQISAVRALTAAMGTMDGPNGVLASKVLDIAALVDDPKVRLVALTEGLHKATGYKSEHAHVVASQMNRELQRKPPNEEVQLALLGSVIYYPQDIRESLARTMAGSEFKNVVSKTDEIIMLSQLASMRKPRSSQTV